MLREGSAWQIHLCEAETHLSESSESNENLMAMNRPQEDVNSLTIL